MALLEDAGYTFTDNGDGSYAISPALGFEYVINENTAHQQVADYDDPSNMLEIFLSTSGNNDMQLGKDATSSAPQNWDEYDALCEQIRTTADFASRVDLMHEAEDMLMDTWAVVPLYYYNDVYMQKSNVDGIYATVTGMKYFMYATKN